MIREVGEGVEVNHSKFSRESMPSKNLRRKEDLILKGREYAHSLLCGELYKSFFIVSMNLFFPGFSPAKIKNLSLKYYLLIKREY